MNDEDTNFFIHQMLINSEGCTPKKQNTMCYDIKTKLETMLKRARHYGDEQTINDLLLKLKPYQTDEIFHTTGFAHPELLVYTNLEPKLPTLSTWGLVPYWVKDKQQKVKLWNSTINARGETIFEKPSFRVPAKGKRCIVFVDGFFEHHHYKGKTFPFYIQRKDGLPMAIAGLWDEWIDGETGERMHSFSIVTTKANALMAKIHNNPKLPEPRMPVILLDDKEEEWLKEISDTKDQATIENKMQTNPND